MNEETSPADLAQRVADLEAERDAAQQARRDAQALAERYQDERNQAGVQARREASEQVRKLTAELGTARGAVKELENKVFGLEQALDVLRTCVARHQRDEANPPGYLQDAVIRAAGIGALHTERDAARKERDGLRARLAEIEAQQPVAWLSPAEVSDDWPWQYAFMAPDAHQHIRDLVGAFPVYARPVPTKAVPDGAIPTVVDALEFRRDQYGLEQRQWAWVLGMQPSHYSEVVAGKRSLPKAAMSMAFAHGVPAAALFQCRPNLGATDIDRRLEQMSAAAPEHKA